MSGLTYAEPELLRICSGLGAREAGGPLSPAEVRLIRQAQTPDKEALRAIIRDVHNAIRAGEDPLGQRFTEARGQVARRELGAFYTDPAIVDAMMRWVTRQRPAEVIDCGSGTGRFAIAAASLPSVTSVIAVEIDPLACLIARANIAALGLHTVKVLNADFTTLCLPDMRGKRAFVGNPPYVRHHGLTADQKHRAHRLAAALGVKWSGLAGLHAHFILNAAALARPGDVLCFITSAEWLDVNYGRGIRELVLDGLRAEEIHLLSQSSAAFADAAATAVILCARAGGEGEEIRVRTASSVSGLTQFTSGGRLVSRTDLRAAPVWGRIIRQQYRHRELAGRIPLGSVARVHRGAVTGANGYFVMTRERAQELGLPNCVRPVLTGAEEILRSGGMVRDNPQRMVLLCPPPLEQLADSDRDALLRYIASGEERGVHRTYVASHRSPWWRPQVKEPPPIVATYMARQAPAFALNPDGLLILNVVHGLYPRSPLDEAQLADLVHTLNQMRDSYRGFGRTYQGGLEKFEPREMERLLLTVRDPGRCSMLCDAPA